MKKKRTLRRLQRKLGLAPKRHARPGASPGSMTISPDAIRPLVEVIAYSAETYEERKIETAAEIDAIARPGVKLWINVDGLGDAELVQGIGSRFGLHPLALEDVVHLHQRPKVESYEGNLFCVLRMASLADHVDTEQLSIFLGPDFVLTFQERPPGDCFGLVRERIRKPGTRMRTRGTDYLAYAIIDAVIDHYYPVLESLGERLEKLEEQVLEQSAMDAVAHIHELRHELLLLRRAVWPLREIVDRLLRGEESSVFHEGTRIYLRDCYDHATQLLELYETCREASSSLMEAYRSALTVRTNEVMRVLTVIATIFIPLTFISSIYGMNFDPDRSPLNMPELRWYFGYPFALILMVGTAGALLLFFKLRGWFNGRR